MLTIILGILRRSERTRLGKATKLVLGPSCYTLKRVSEPSASIRVTVLLFIHISLASLIGFNLATSAIGAVLYDFTQRVCDVPNPNIPEIHKIRHLTMLNTICDYS